MRAMPVMQSVDQGDGRPRDEQLDFIAGNAGDAGNAACRSRRRPSARRISSSEQKNLNFVAGNAGDASDAVRRSRRRPARRFSHFVRVIIS